MVDNRILDSILRRVLELFENKDTYLMNIIERELTEYYLDANQHNKMAVHSVELLAGLLERGLIPHSVILGVGEEAQAIEPLISSLSLRVPVYRAPEEQIAAFLSEQTGLKIKPYALSAVVEVPALPFSEETLLRFRRVVIVSNINYVNNIARIVDLCIWFGADALFFTETGKSPFFSKVSLLTDLRNLDLPVVMLPGEPDEYITIFRSCGYTVIGAALRRESLDPLDLRQFSGSRTALMFGNESHGLRDEELDVCDHIVRIPMAEGIDSLNVAEACGIALYELSAGDHHGKELT